MRADIRTFGGAAALLVALLLGTPCIGQVALDDPTETYEREVFYYDQAGRADPFRSLLEDAEMGMRLEDLSLRGVVHHAAGRPAFPPAAAQHAP